MDTHKNFILQFMELHFQWKWLFYFWPIRSTNMHTPMTFAFQMDDAHYTPMPSIQMCMLQCFVWATHKKIEEIPNWFFVSKWIYGWFSMHDRSRRLLPFPKSRPAYNHTHTKKAKPCNRRTKSIRFTPVHPKAHQKQWENLNEIERKARTHTNTQMPINRTETKEVARE